MPLVLRKWFTVALWNSNLREGRRHRKWQKWPDFHTGSPIVFSTQGGRDRSQILALIWYTKHHSLVTWSCFFLEIFPSSTRLLVSRWRPADSGSFITLMVASTMIDYRSHSHLANSYCPQKVRLHRSRQLAMALQLSLWLLLMTSSCLHPSWRSTPQQKMPFLQLFTTSTSRTATNNASRGDTILWSTIESTLISFPCNKRASSSPISITYCLGGRPLTILQQPHKIKRNKYECSSKKTNFGQKPTKLTIIAPLYMSTKQRPWIN